MTDTRWYTRALCQANPDWWVVNGPGLSRDNHRAQRICTGHCPVLAECDDDAEANPPRGMIAAGRVWNAKGRPNGRVTQPAPAKAAS